MANSVVLEVILEGKNIKVVQRQVEATTDAVNENTASQKRNTEATDKGSTAKNRYMRTEKGVAGITSNSSKGFAKQAQGISGGLVPAYAILAANIFAVGAAFNALSAASRVEQLTSGITELGKASGLAMGYLSEGLREATGNALSLEEAMRSTAIITSAGLDPSSIERFGEVARNASIALGRDTADSLARLTRGVTKLEPELLDELGIMVRLDEAVETYAIQMGKAASDLTNFERRQAFLNATLEQGEDKFGSIGKAVSTNPYDKLAASFQDLSKIILTVVNVAIKPVVGFLSASPAGLLTALTLFAGTLIGKMIPAFDDLKATADENSESMERLRLRTLGNVSALKDVSPSLTKYQQEMKAGIKTTRSYAQVQNDTRLSFEGRKSAFSNAIKKDIVMNNGIINLIKSSKAWIVSVFRTGNAYRSAGKAQSYFAYQTFLSVLAQEQKQQADIVSQITQGDLAGGISAATASLGTQITALFTAAGASTFLSGINVFLAGSFKIAANAALFLGATMATVLPIITGVMAAMAILGPIFSYIVDLFTSPAQKAYTEQAEKLSDVTKELTVNTIELDRAFLGASKSILAADQRATSAFNIFSQFSVEYKKLKDLSPDGDFEASAEALDKFIGSSKRMQAGLAAQTKGAKTVDEIQKNLNVTLAEATLLAEEYVEGQLKLATAAKALAEATKESGESFGQFLTTLKVKTPYDEVVSSIQKIVLNMNTLKELDPSDAFENTKLVLEGLTDSQVQFFDLGAEKKSLTEYKKAVAEADEAVAVERANVGFNTNSQLQAITKNRLSIEARLTKENAKEDSEQKEINIAHHLNRLAELDAAERALLPSMAAAQKVRQDGTAELERQTSETEKLLSAGLQVLDSVRFQKVTQKSLLTTQEQIISATKRSGSSTLANLNKVNTAEAEIRRIKIEGINSQIALAKQNLGVDKEGNKLVFNREATQEEIKNLTVEQQNSYYKIIESLQQIQDIEAETRTDKEAILDAAKTQVENIEQLQIGSRAVLEIDQKRLDLANEKLATDQASQSIANQMASAKGGRGFKEDPSQKKSRMLDEEFLKKRNAAVNTEETIKKAMIDLEYTLLEAKLLETKAQIAVLNEGREEGNKISIKGLDAAIQSVGKEGALRIAAAEAAEDAAGLKRSQYALEDAKITKEAADYESTIKEKDALDRVNLESSALKANYDLQKKTFTDRLKAVDNERKVEEERLRTLNAADRGVKKRKLTADQVLKLEKETEEKKRKILEDQKTVQLQVIEIEFKLLRAKTALQQAQAKLVVEQLKLINSEEGNALEATMNTAYQANDQLITDAETAARETVNSAFNAAIAGLQGKTADATEDVGVTAGGKGVVTADPFANALSNSASVLDGEGGIAGKLEAAGQVAASFGEEMAKLGPAGGVISAATQGMATIGTAISDVKKSFDNAGEGIAGTGTKIAAVTGAMAAGIGAVSAVQAAQSKAAVAAVDQQIAAEKNKDGKSAQLAFRTLLAEPWTP